MDPKPSIDPGEKVLLDFLKARTEDPLASRGELVLRVLGIDKPPIAEIPERIVPENLLLRAAGVRTVKIY